MPDTATISAMYKTKLLGPINELVGAECRWLENDDGQVLRWDQRRDHYVAILYTSPYPEQGFYSQAVVKGCTIEQLRPAFAEEARITSQHLHACDVSTFAFIRVVQHEVRRAAERLRRALDDFRRTVAWNPDLLEGLRWDDIDPERDFVKPPPHSKEAVKRFWFDVRWEAEDRIMWRRP